MQYASIIKKMTLEEKASLLSGGGLFRSKSIPRLNIPSMDFADGPHGVRKQAGASDHLGLNASLPATCYPTASAIANSWDEELGEELGSYMGKEAASQGLCPPRNGGCRPAESLGIRVEPQARLDSALRREF